MANFDFAYKLTSGHEGGYVNDPDDKGGETYRGIARKFWPNWPGWKKIDAIKKHRTIKRYEMINDTDLNCQVYEFYLNMFWNRNRLSEINDQKIANEIYDTGVNMGVSTGARMLQQALNLLNRNQKDYRDIPEDGIIGFETLQMVNYHKNQAAILKTLNGLQFARYVEICKRDKTQEKFFYGWLNRT